MTIISTELGETAAASGAATGTNASAWATAGIEGDWDDYRGFNVWGGKIAENPASFSGKSWGTIAIGGVLY